MAWQRVKAGIAGRLVDALLWDTPDRFGLTVAWRDGVEPGQEVTIGDATHRIESARQPGNRREILEIELLRPPDDGQAALAFGSPDAAPLAEVGLAALVAAITGLDFDDPAQIRPPSAATLSDAVGRRVSAAERDAAWHAYTEAEAEAEAAEADDGAAGPGPAPDTDAEADTA